MVIGQGENMGMGQSSQWVITCTGATHVTWYDWNIAGLRLLIVANSD